MTGHILMVDDDPDILELYAPVLEAAGHRVTAVSTALAALEVVDSDTPDALLLDVQVPGIGGFDLVNLLRNDCYDLPVLIFTGFDSADVRDQAAHLECVDVLVKPMAPDELLERVETALANWESADR
jgi:DNA-binding response OmpR family regulator